ncbi:hypothetical protein HK102_002439, partial [Quaeritorhiza haematococci]
MQSSPGGAQPPTIAAAPSATSVPPPVPTQPSQPLPLPTNTSASIPSTLPTEDILLDLDLYTDTELLQLRTELTKRN